MGRTITPKYAVEFFDVRANGRFVHWTPMGWNSKQAGRPTVANLAAFVNGYEESTKPGAPNAHLGVTTIWSARIVRNDGSHTVVANYQKVSA